MTDDYTELTDAELAHYVAQGRVAVFQNRHDAWLRSLPHNVQMGLRKRGAEARMERLDAASPQMRAWCNYAAAAFIPEPAAVRKDGEEYVQRCMENAEKTFIADSYVSRGIYAPGETIRWRRR